MLTYSLDHRTGYVTIKPIMEPRFDMQKFINELVTTTLKTGSSIRELYLPIRHFFILARELDSSTSTIPSKIEMNFSTGLMIIKPTPMPAISMVLDK